MRIVFIRHGERRRGESDPALTSAGRRMARETALWLEQRGVRPAHVMTTPTQRTRETADELGLVFGEAIRAERPESPEVLLDWTQLVERLETSPGVDRVIALVGHHPTVDLLLRAFGPPPVPVPRQNFASALVLERVAARWTIRDAWPGRAS